MKQIILKYDKLICFFLFQNLEINPIVPVRETKQNISETQPLLL